MIIKNLKYYFKRIYAEAIYSAKKMFGVPYIKVKLQSGDRLCVRVNDILGKSLFMNKSFEEMTKNAIFSRIKKGMTVLDIGANIGYYTVLMSRAVGETGRVIAFEPNPVMVEELKKNIRVNNLKNVIIEQIALSSENGQTDFYCPEYGAESYGSLKPNSTFSVKNTLQVKTVKVDDVLARIDCRNIDLVKIDAEGAEYSILRGAEKLLTIMKPDIFFECAENLCEPFGHSVLDVLAHLSAKGYKVRQVDYGMWHGEANSGNVK